MNSNKRNRQPKLLEVSSLFKFQLDYNEAMFDSLKSLIFTLNVFTVTVKS